MVVLAVAGASVIGVPAAVVLAVLCPHGVRRSSARPNSILQILAAAVADLRRHQPQLSRVREPTSSFPADLFAEKYPQSSEGKGVAVMRRMTAAVGEAGG